MQPRGLSYSLLLHSAMLVLLGVGLPVLFPDDRDLQPIAISVEVLPISEISNVPKRQLPEKKEEPKPKPSPKKEPPKPKPTVKETPKPEPVAPPKPAEKAEKKPAPKPKETAKSKPKKEDAFDQLLKDLSDSSDSSDAKETPKNPTQNSAKSKSDRYDPTIPLSISEKDAIRSQFAKHWRLPAGVRDDYTLRVEVRILVNRDGSVKQAGIASHQAGRYARDPIFRAAADSALRAVKLASPLSGLSPDKYSTWKDMVVNFDPKEMLY
jgi:outer membrane biosynthesis protein TonB